MHWHSALRRRLIYTLALLAAGTVPLLLCSNIWLLMILVFIAGIAVSPSLISAFTLTERLVPSDAVTEGFTPLGTAVGLGVALGAGPSGKLIDLSRASTAFIVATVAAGVAALVVLAGQPALTERHPARRVAPDA